MITVNLFAFIKGLFRNDKPLVLKDENGELWEVGYIDQFPDYSDNLVHPVEGYFQEE
jgi:hypothetical protein